MLAHSCLFDHRIQDHDVISNSMVCLEPYLEVIADPCHIHYLLKPVINHAVEGLTQARTNGFASVVDWKGVVPFLEKWA